MLVILAWAVLQAALVAVLPDLNLWWGTLTITLTGLASWVLVDRLRQRRGAHRR